MPFLQVRPRRALRREALVVMALLAAGDALVRGGATDEIVGTWRGTSVCVDRVAAPACTDEQVVYDISDSPGKAGTVTVTADKVVDGKRVPMGALDLTRDAHDGSWTSEFENPRVHFMWRLTVKGTRIQGSMTLIPSKAVVRRIDLRRDK